MPDPNSPVNPAPPKKRRMIMMEPGLEPMEQEHVRNILDEYGKKYQNPDDAESAAVAEGKLERGNNGVLRPKGWSGPAKPVDTKPRNIEEQTQAVLQEVPDLQAEKKKVRKIGSFQQYTGRPGGK